MDRQLAFSEACSGKLKKVRVSLSSVRLSWWFCRSPVVWDWGIDGALPMTLRRLPEPGLLATGRMDPRVQSIEL